MVFTKIDIFIFIFKRFQTQFCVVLSFTTLPLSNSMGFFFLIIIEAVFKLIFVLFILNCY